jgi:hypothetical protein
MTVYHIDTSALSEAGAWCALRHPGTGQPLTSGGRPVRVLLAGPDAPRFRTARRHVRDALLERLAAARDKDDTAALAELEAEAEREMAAALTLAWENVRLPDGEPLACSTDNARRLYRDLPWLLAQVGGFAAERANFITASGNG